ncbi:MAG: acyl-CoA dehydrogenase family protein, partial [Myxococcota bacterium]
MADFINRRDLDFLLYELCQTERLAGSAHFLGHGRETFDAIVDTAYKIAKDLFEPHAMKLDRAEPQLEHGRVELIPEVKEATDAFVEAGFTAMSFSAQLGGMQLPYTISQAVMAIFYAANTATAAYPLLSVAAANLLAMYADEEQTERFLLPMVEGRFFGTMCLSEPHAGSSLSDIKTVAEPSADGKYRLRGNKMWISAGEHELSENIVHLVLAKLPGSPAGVKGISLFIVPKFLVEADGSLGARNDVHVTGVNHKMGYRGTVNTV